MAQFSAKRWALASEAREATSDSLHSMALRWRRSSETATVAKLIPSLGSCVSRMTQGERRLAERLEQKLDDDYLIWYDLPVGPSRAHPDFVILHPRRGVLILEVKSWRLDTIRQASRQTWEILDAGELKSVINPIEQARHYAHQVVDALSRDKLLVDANGPWKGKLSFPWTYGVVLTQITRRQFGAAGLDQAIEPHRVVCFDEMTDLTDAEDFQSLLWAMFPTRIRGVMSLPQIDHVRAILYPEVRVDTQLDIFGRDGELADSVPDLVRVMDLHQEQLARSLGDGHRVIHGVAGSGKTMILAYRAQQLAQAASRERPVLVLCYNEPLATKLTAVMAAKGLSERVVVRNFHKWCRQQLVAYGQPIPQQGPTMFDQMVENVIKGVERDHIPSGQYLAVLIDEGHDFQPEWLRLAAQMVDPATQCLLVLYDDAQNIYEQRRSRQFSFKSVGIQAQGRTTVLKINYRNTLQVLQVANVIAGDLLRPEDRDDDGILKLQPVSCGREGHPPIVVKVASLQEEARKVAELLAAAHEQGTPWGDMAIICRRHRLMYDCAAVLRQRGLPHQIRDKSGSYDPRSDTIKIITMHASKGLEFPVVALPGIGYMPEDGEDEANEARLFYVAATRATERLIITLSGQGAFAAKLLTVARPVTA